MIYVGIDDTDIAGSRGTNQLARSLVAALTDRFRCVRIVRHQLLQDPRVPCTTKNGSASITLEPIGGATLNDLASRVRDHLLASFIEGSDPGMCLSTVVPEAVEQFGYRAKHEFLLRQQAFEMAARHGLLLEGLGGTCDGVIGALAAVGLAATSDDGRVVQLAEWPDDLSGVRSIESLESRGVVVRLHSSGQKVISGLVDVGKRLRPNRSRGEDVLFVRGTELVDHQPLLAIKLP